MHKKITGEWNKYNTYLLNIENINLRIILFYNKFTEQLILFGCKFEKYGLSQLNTVESSFLIFKADSGKCINYI